MVSYGHTAAQGTKTIKWSFLIMIRSSFLTHVQGMIEANFWCSLSNAFPATVAFLVLFQELNTMPKSGLYFH